MLETYASTSTPTATESKSTTSVPAAMITPAPTPAALGCSIFHSYISICSSSLSLGSAATTTDTSSALASCACYSVNYYVPDVLDSAAKACAGFTSASISANPSTSLNALATSASKMEGFCSHMGNLRSLSSAQFGQATATSASATGSSTEQSSNAQKLAPANMGLWAVLFAGALAF